jgi:alpha-mannosidase
MTWDGELYLELHNGTYTSMAENKRYNRMAEILLRDLEIVSSLASLMNDKYRYELAEIREMWRTFLTDQFHDVLPGTCIGMVYEDTRKNF